MEIVNMNTLSSRQLREAAAILNQVLPIWCPTMEAAEEALRECLSPGNTQLAAVENGEVIGFGGILTPTYDGRVYELHPLAVRADKQKQGVGKLIITALEDEARARGGLTLWLGSDDETDETSLSNCDLYDDLPAKLRDFRPGIHPSGFYLKMGYKIIGVMPDANGRGRPDIYMAKAL